MDSWVKAKNSKIRYEQVKEATHKAETGSMSLHTKGVGPFHSWKILIRGILYGVYPFNQSSDQNDELNA